jgi:N-acetylmuramoyl-L-alanine amidase
VNAAGSDEKWHKARGWQVHTYTKPSQESIKFANILFDTTSNLGLKVRRPSPNQNYWMNDFWILKHSKCPAVLTENFFQDNEDDVEFLLSDKGINSVVKLHVDSIIKYCG